MSWRPEEFHISDPQWSIINTCSTLSEQTHWVQGFAGSGKSVLLVYMVERIFLEEPDAKVCVVAFTHALKDMLLNGIQPEFRDRVRVITKDNFLGEDEDERYDFVVLDEVQDIPKEELRRIKRRSDTLVVAGDTEQSIFVSKSSSEEEIIEKLEPDIHVLDTIFRLTQKLKEIVCTILPNSRIETALMDRYESVEITLAKANSVDQEIQWVWENCEKHAVSTLPAVVLFPKHVEIQSFIRKISEIHEIPPIEFLKGNDERIADARTRWYFQMNELFQENEVPMRFLGSGIGTLDDSELQPLTYIMTYHSSKGLDFNTVFLPKLDQGQNFWNIQKDKEKDPDIDRRLLFVAATRSRLNLFLSYSSINPHPYVQGMPQELLHKEECRLNEQAIENGNNDFPF